MTTDLARDWSPFEALTGKLEDEARTYLALAEQRAARIPGIAPEAASMPLASVGIVGAGTMGRGIASSCASVGLQVVLVDSDEAVAGAAVETIQASYLRSVARGRMTSSEASANVARISTSTSLDALHAVDCVIEAVFESLEVKQAVFEQLDTICRPGALLATNTSTLDVNKIADATGRPADVIGLHFFAPAHVMRLLEIVRGSRTSGASVANALALARRLRKVAVVVGVCFGFVGNRMAYAYGLEASRLLLEGALPWQVDTALEHWGMAMGPFTVADLSGLDVDWRVRQEMTLTPEQQALSRIDDLLVDLGRYGQKTGLGFYRYPGGPTAGRVRDTEVEELIVAEAKRQGFDRRSISNEEILLRCLLALVNEAGRILDDGIALRGSDIDLVYAHGYGFPSRFGGPLFLASHVGLAEVVETLGRLQESCGSRFKPAAALQRAATHTSHDWLLEENI